jgi:hypothetical protein
MKCPWILASLLCMAASTSAQAAPPPAADGLFVAVGYGGFRGWSSDGQTWVAERWSDKNQDDDNIIFSLTFRDGIFLCAGGGAARGFILRSTDGKRWEQVVKDRYRITGVLTLPDRFLSVFAGHFQTSTDGVQWQPLAEARVRAADGVGGGFFRRWAVGHGAVVFAGDYDLGGGKPRVGWIGGSKNGETPMTLQKQSADIRGLDFGNGRFVACAKDGVILTSTDGLAFTPVATVADEYDDNSVRFADGAFFLRGRHGVQSSTDGQHWTPVAKPPRIPRAAAPGGAAIVCGWGGIPVAPDGKTYHKADVPIDATGICAVVYGVPRDRTSPPR